MTVTEMPLKVYFKSVETIAVAANSAGLSKGEEVEITGLLSARVLLFVSLSVYALKINA